MEEVFVVVLAGHESVDSRHEFFFKAEYYAPYSYGCRRGGNCFCDCMFVAQALVRLDSNKAGGYESYTVEHGYFCGGEFTYKL